jgi:endogenous inhibitor of DNA gyrase (YacG/DUF329 family)
MWRSRFLGNLAFSPTGPTFSTMNTKKIMIRCPKTSKAVFTGMAMDEKSFADPTNKFVNNSIQCPHCGQMHTWSKEDAFLE